MQAKRILCTGTSGFIGSQIVLAALQQGHHVRAIVRSEAKARAWQERHQVGRQIEWMVVEDMTKAGSFTQAVQGVDWIMHAASPVNYSSKDLKSDIIEPAVEMVQSIFEAAANESSVKRIVMTSSLVAMLPVDLSKASGRKFTHDDWSDVTVDQAVRTKNGIMAYQASKTLAERAAWDFIRDARPSFDLTTLLPGMVYGPPMQPIAKSMAALNQSLQDVWGLVDKPMPRMTPFPFYCDVRDIADLHLLAANQNLARNRRYSTVAGHFSFSEMAEAIRSDSAISEKNRSRIASGGQQSGPKFDIDSSRVEELGLRWRPFAEAIRDTARALFALEEKLNQGVM